MPRAGADGTLGTLPGPIPPRGPEAETVRRVALTPGGLSRYSLGGVVRGSERNSSTR